MIPDAQLNYPSFSVKLNRGSNKGYTRTVTNVGEPSSIYHFVCEYDSKTVDIRVAPSRLVFSKANQKLNYNVTFSRSSLSRNNNANKTSFSAAYKPSTAARSNPYPLMMNQLVAGNQDPVVKAFVGNEFGDEIFPISENKPFFDIVLAKRNVKPLYRMDFPEEICPLLPSSKVPAILTCNSKTWKTILIGDRDSKKFEQDSWKTFVTDNNLKLGDCLVFQIMESCADEIKFTVQILRGEFPSELEDLVAANTVNID